MPRWTLIVLLAVGVIGAAIGTALTLQTTPQGPANFGWTAYSPLSNSSYSPNDPTQLFWASKLAAALLAIGAGTTGATSVALLLTRNTHTTTPTTNAN